MGICLICSFVIIIEICYYFVFVNALEMNVIYLVYDLRNWDLDL